MGRKYKQLQQPNVAATWAMRETFAPKSTDLLKKNVQAIGRTNMCLARRLCSAVELSHINVSNPENPTYRLHRNEYPLSADDNSAEILLTTVPAGKAVLLFGAGSGVLLKGIRRVLPATKIHIWDRDPAVLRTLLSHVDLCEEILNGRVVVHMGADFVDLIHLKEQLHFIAHPLLGQIYSQEAYLWEVGVHGDTVCVATGELLVPDLEDSLRGCGYSVFPLELVRVSQHEIDYGIRKLKPSFIAGINYVTGMEIVAARHNLPIICWDMDPTADRLAKAESNSSLLHLFSCRPYLVDSFKKQGFENVHFLPLATNPKRRRPMTLTPEQFDYYGAQVSFVGASLTTDAIQYQEHFLATYSEWRGAADERSEAQSVLNTVLAEQRADFTVYRIPELMRTHAGDFLDFVASVDPCLEPIRWIAEIAAMEKRLTTVANLGHFKPAVWGDSGWRTLEKYGIRYMGGAGHLEELTRVYNASLINVDIGRIYQTDIPPMRIFDIMACGVFQLAEHSDAIAELFKVGEEIETWRTLDELKSKIQYYLNNPIQAGKIAGRGMKVVREKHTVEQRLKYMLETTEI